MQCSQTIFTALCSGATYHSLDTGDISSDFVQSKKFIISVRTFIHGIKGVKLEDRNSDCEVNFVLFYYNRPHPKVAGRKCSQSCVSICLCWVPIPWCTGNLCHDALRQSSLLGPGPDSLAWSPRKDQPGRTCQDGGHIPPPMSNIKCSNKSGLLFK